MNFDIFFAVVVGHILGDFLLQPSSLAVKKGASNWTCTLHVLIYTASIALLTNLNPVWLAFVFVSHWIIDRFSLADVWLKIIHSRPLTGFLKNGDLDIPDFKKEIAKEWYGEAGNDKAINDILLWPATEQESQNRKLNYRILRGSFSAICYVVTDQFFHLVSMICFYKWWFGN